MFLYDPQLIKRASNLITGRICSIMTRKGFCICKRVATIKRSF